MLATIASMLIVNKDNQKPIQMEDFIPWIEDLPVYISRFKCQEK